MNEMVRKIQFISYGILCDVDDYCRKNNICYFLGGGSALGAVRHNGFIPWDDDIDIMMPRKDYERLLEGFGKEYGEKYGIGSIETDPNWARPYARIWDLRTKMRQDSTGEQDLGILIDIFPIDGVPEGKLGQKIFYLRLRIANTLRNAAQRKSFLSGEKHRAIKNFLHVFAARKGARYYAEKLDKIATKYDFDECNYVGASLAVHYWTREAIEKEHFSAAVYKQFETRELPLPVGYDRYLKNLYGDYMTIPAEAEKQGYTHLDRWEIEINDDFDFSKMNETIGVNK